MTTTWMARRIVTAGGIASGMEMGFHLLRRAGFDEAACIMEDKAAYDLYRNDVGYAGAREPHTKSCSFQAGTGGVARIIHGSSVWPAARIIHGRAFGRPDEPPAPNA